MLAGLRAHYPEHQHKRKRKRKKKRRRNQNQHTPHALLPNTNHHRYSTMTQPCHKDTALNQQCCDSKHKGRGEKERNTTFTMRPHTPPQHDSIARHNTATATRQQCCTHHHTSPPTTNTTTQNKKGTGTIRGEQTMRRGADNARCQTQSEHGGSTAHTTPAFQ